MAFALNLLNLQTQPEMPQKVSAKAKTSAADRTQPKDEFYRVLRDLRKKANAEEKAPKVPNEQEEYLLAEVLTAFPSLPGKVVMHAEEGETGEESLEAIAIQPTLATEQEAFPQLAETVGLSAEADGEANAAFLASPGDGSEALAFSLETATEATAESAVLPEGNGDGAQMAGFPGVMSKDQGADSVYTTGGTLRREASTATEATAESAVLPEGNGDGAQMAGFPGVMSKDQGADSVYTTGGTLRREASTANQEFRAENNGLVDLTAVETEGTVVEAEGEPTGIFDRELGAVREGIEPALTQKGLAEELNQPEIVHSRPEKNAASLKNDLTQSGEEETSDLAREGETVDLWLASVKDSLGSGKRRVDDQDAPLHQLFEAAMNAPGETAEAAENLASLDKTVPSTLPQEEVVGQIINGAKLMVKDEVAKIELQLQPAELGKLELSLVVERDLVTARFVAETQGVQSLIEANLSELRSALQEAGLTVDLLQVDVQTGNESGLQEHAFTAGHRSTPGAAGQNRTDELFAVEESFLAEDSWHGLVNLRV